MPTSGIIKNQHVNPDKAERSRTLRKSMTEAEDVFWNLVRGRKFNSLKFRRQQVIDGFIIDFYCDSLGLCVEIDGPVHEMPEQADYDRQRDAVLSLRGLKILRLSNDKVLQAGETVYSKLREAV